MLDTDDYLRQRLLMSRLLRGGWYKLLEDSRMQISCRGGSTTIIVLANDYLDQQFMLSDCFDFSATEMNSELWQAFRQLCKNMPAEALNLLSLPIGVYKLVSEASDAEIGRISQRFFSCFKLRDKCLPMLRDAIDGTPGEFQSISPAHKRFLSLFWVNVWRVAVTQPSRAATMFDLPFDMAQAFSTLSASRIFQIIDCLSSSSYELRFNPYLVEGLIKYPDDCMIFSLMQIQQSIQKSEDVKLSLTYQEPEIEVDSTAILEDMKRGMTRDEIVNKYKIDFSQIYNIIKDNNKLKNKFLKTNEELRRQIDNYYKELAELLVIWGLSPEIIRSITGMTATQFRTIKAKVDLQGALPTNYWSLKFPGRHRSKLSLGDKVIASLFVSIYSRIGTSNIYRTVNVPAMIVSQMVVQTLAETPFFAPLQAAPFNPIDAWTWARDLQAATAQFVHCPHCGCLYIARFEDDEPENLPVSDANYDPNLDYSHPCPYCRYIETYCDFGSPGKTHQAAAARKLREDEFYAHLAKCIAPLD